MEYPDFDPAPEAAHREQWKALLAGIERTTAQQTTAQQTLIDLQARRSKLCDAAARGDSIAPDAHRVLEADIRATEADVLHLAEVLKRQERMRANHDLARGKVRGLAHHPRVIHAIRELSAAGPEIDGATRALHAAQRRDNEARQVLNMAWGAGYPMPSALTPVAGISSHPGIPKLCDDRTLRSIFGELADEALAPVAEAAAA